MAVPQEIVGRDRGLGITDKIHPILIFFEIIAANDGVIASGGIDIDSGIAAGADGVVLDGGRGSVQIQIGVIGMSTILNEAVFDKGRSPCV